ncbi:MAG TPA: hypothetical protein VFP26_10525 [Gemmatimonadaceae bacterium]|nr:hypothetical protein [Gemmatimonadaceae bacterium]
MQILFHMLRRDRPFAHSEALAHETLVLIFDPLQAFNSVGRNLLVHDGVTRRTQEKQVFWRISIDTWKTELRTRAGLLALSNDVRYLADKRIRISVVSAFNERSSARLNRAETACARPYDPFCDFCHRHRMPRVTKFQQCNVMIVVSFERPPGVIPLKLSVKRQNAAQNAAQNGAEIEEKIEDLFTSRSHSS